MHGRPRFLAGGLWATALAVVAAWVLIAAPATRAALGDLDSGYGHDGFAVGYSTASASGVFVDDLLVDPSSRATLAGRVSRSSAEGNGSDMLLARFTAAGALDGAFGSGGVTRIGAFGSFAGLRALAVQPDGAIVGAGTFPTGGSDAFALVRVTSGGQRDDSFGNGGPGVGITPNPFDASSSRAAGVIVLPDGRLLAGGDATDAGGPPSLVLARFTAAGVPQATFKIAMPSMSAIDARAVAMDAAGRVLLRGRATIGGVTRGFVARLTAAGELDQAFAGGDGVVDFAESAGDGGGVAVLPDGGILVAGADQGAGSVLRLSAAGAIEAGPFGYRSGSDDTTLTDLALDAAGRPLGAGRFSQPAAPGGLVLGQFDARGLLDPVLDADGPQPGLFRIPSSGATATYGTSVAVDGQGRPHTASVRSQELLVTRHLPNALPIAAFNAPATLTVAQEAIFDGAASSDPERALRRFEWDFDGDGSFETDGGANPAIARSFAAPGDRTVSVRVTDHGGLVATASRVVRVLAAAAQPLAPDLGSTAVLQTTRGKVRVRLPGSRTFVDLSTVREVPEGTEVDARRGRVQIIVARNRQGDVDAAIFYFGRFRFTQADSAAPTTTVALTGGSFKGCGTAKPKLRVPIASAAAKRKSRRRVIRRLWGNGQGRFRTKGRYASATVRGTRWQTIDRCDGVGLQVVEGTVEFRDLLRATRARRVRAGRRAFVPSPGSRSRR